MGESVSRLFAEHGASVVVLDKVPDRAHRVSDAITADGGRSIPLIANLRDDGALPSVIEQTLSTYGAVDVLVNIAGGMHPESAWRPLREGDVAEWDFIFRQNVRWVQLLSCMAADAMIAGGRGGAVISIGSVSGIFGAPNHAAYGAAKAALIHLMRSLTLEYGRYGVRFNSISPGSIRTPAVAGWLTPEQAARDDITTPLGRAGTPEDIAKAVLFLASDLSGFVSGQNLIVDGGATVRFPLPSPGAHPSESLT
jgi:NAD(P)-dependent dehydrogenase (short-subunit alcohol dehydrogenase family)